MKKTILFVFLISINQGYCMYEEIENTKRVAAFFITGSKNNNAALIVVARLLNELTLDKAKKISGQYYNDYLNGMNQLKQSSIDRLLSKKVEKDKAKESGMEFLAIIKRNKRDPSSKNIKWLGNNQTFSEPLTPYINSICANDMDKKGVLITNLSLNLDSIGSSAVENLSQLDVNCTSPIAPPDNGHWQPKNIKSSSIKNTPNGRVRIAKLKKYVKSTNDS